MEEEKQKVEKLVVLKENFNNKIGCDFMCHIMKPKRDKLPPEAFEERIVFKCGEVECAYNLWDYVPERIDQIPPRLYMSSYGAIVRQQFHERMYLLYELTSDRQAGIYFFIKAAP